MDVQSCFLLVPTMEVDSFFCNPNESFIIFAAYSIKDYCWKVFEYLPSERQLLRSDINVVCAWLAKRC